MAYLLEYEIMGLVTVNPSTRAGFTVLYQQLAVLRPAVLILGMLT